MGIFDYKNLGTEGSKALFADAMAITLYTYHNLDNGFAVGYQHNGLGLGLPATLVGALLGSTDSQGVIPGLPWNPDSEKAALDAVQRPAGRRSAPAPWATAARSMHEARSSARRQATPRPRSRCWASTMTPANSWKSASASRHLGAAGNADQRLHRRPGQRSAGGAGAQGLREELRRRSLWRLAQERRRLRQRPWPEWQGRSGQRA